MRQSPVMNKVLLGRLTSDPRRTDCNTFVMPGKSQFEAKVALDSYWYLVGQVTINKSFKHSNASVSTVKKTEWHLGLKLLRARETVYHNG